MSTTFLDFVVHNTNAFGVIAADSTVLLTQPLVQVVGFGTAGVLSGSAAASIQSILYGGLVPVGSTFALCQSVGAAGLSTVAITVGGVIIAVGVGVLLKSFIDLYGTDILDWITNLMGWSEEWGGDLSTGASGAEKRIMVREIGWIRA